MSEKLKSKEPEQEQGLYIWLEALKNVDKWVAFKYKGQDTEKLAADYRARIEKLSKSEKLQVLEYHTDVGGSHRSIETYGDEDTRLDSSIPLEDFAGMTRIAESHEAVAVQLDPRSDTGREFLQTLSDKTKKPLVALIREIPRVEFTPAGSHDILV